MFALALVSIFFGAAAFLVVLVALVAVFFGAAAFFVVAFGLTSFSTFSAFGLASFFGAAGFFSTGTFLASLMGPEGPVEVSVGARWSEQDVTYPLAAQIHRPLHLA